MGKPYSLDLRERVVAALEGGMSTAQAAARFSIGKATAGAWGRLKRSQGDVRPAKQGKPKGSVLDAHEAFILGALQVSGSGNIANSPWYLYPEASYGLATGFFDSKKASNEESKFH